MKAVNVVVVDDVHGDINEILLCARMAGIEPVVGAVECGAARVLRKPLRVLVDDVAAVARHRLRPPDEQAVRPDVHLYARTAAVSLLDEIRERVESAR
jgi:hypothetical protein